MIIKYIIISLLIAILASLGSALYFLINDKTGGKRTAKALTWRIGLSLTLFIILMVAFSFHLIHPHG